jgi:hypothetical protein
MLTVNKKLGSWSSRIPARVSSPPHATEHDRIAEAEIFRDIPMRLETLWNAERNRFSKQPLVWYVWFGTGAAKSHPMTRPFAILRDLKVSQTRVLSAPTS